MQESYETVISLAEEIAISWPRITAFTETRGRRGLAPGLEMEPEQGQLAPLQGQAAAAAATTAGSSEEGILPDFRRQLGVILQTVGKAQVEKMLRELVKEQEQQGRVRRRKRVTRSPRHGAGDGTAGHNSLETPQELHGGTAEGPAVLSRKPHENELQVPLLCPGLVAGQKQPISGKTLHRDARECKNSLTQPQSPLDPRWGTGPQPRESISCNLLHNLRQDSHDGGRVWPPFGERTQFFSGWQKPRYTQRRRRLPAGEKPHRCGPCRRAIVAPPARSNSPPNATPLLNSASVSSPIPPLNSVEPLTSTQPLPVNSASAPSRKPHACEECGKRFRILANLERHQQRHAAEKPHQCRDCGRRFRWGCHLERHRRSRRCVECGGGLATPPPPPSPPPEPDRPYSCGECGRRFTQRSALSKHRRLHSGERPYGCGECGKRFLQRSDLTIHVRSHSGEQPYVCTECGRRFSVSSNLSKHRRMHRGERPHACSVCAKRFLQRSELLIHQRAHTGERPYPCTACGKRFARRAHLKRHQRTHGVVPATTAASRQQSARLLTTSGTDTVPLLDRQQHEHGVGPDTLESRPHTNALATGSCPPSTGSTVFSAARGPISASSVSLPWSVSSSARLPFCSSSL